MLDTRGLVLGELAVRENLITREQLDGALARQEHLHFEKKLGEVLVEQGVLTGSRLEDLLERQKEKLAEYEKKFSVSGLFGRMAVESGYISEAMLAACIREQLWLDSQGEHKKIGQIMLRWEMISLEQFWELIQKQGPFQCGACGASLEKPTFENRSIICQRCGLPALALDV